jgi:hypothetical protein
MEMTTHDMERPAAMPTAAPVGAVAPGQPLAAANLLPVHGTFAPPVQDRQGNSVKPWTTGYGRPIGHLFGREMTGRPARHLGRPST